MSNIDLTRRIFYLELESYLISVKNWRRKNTPSGPFFAKSKDSSNLKFAWPITCLRLVKQSEKNQNISTSQWRQKKDQSVLRYFKACCYIENRKKQKTLFFAHASKQDLKKNAWINMQDLQTQHLRFLSAFAVQRHWKILLILKQAPVLKTLTYRDGKETRFAIFEVCIKIFFCCHEIKRTARNIAKKTP